MNENRIIITVTITGLDPEGQIVGDIECVLDDLFDSEAVMAIEEAGATVTGGEELVTA
jgi:hypothetical protein